MSDTTETPEAPPAEPEANLPYLIGVRLRECFLEDRHDCAQVGAGQQHQRERLRRDASAQIAAHTPGVISVLSQADTQRCHRTAETR